jgi:hypothetical protein
MRDPLRPKRIRLAEVVNARTGGRYTAESAEIRSLPEAEIDRVLAYYGDGHPGYVY